MLPHSLSVVIPAYNEDQYVKESVEINLNILRKSNIDFELIIVDDGSADTTADIIKEHYSNISNVKVYFKDHNEGFGGAVRFGISKASKDYILVVPVDSPLTENVFNKFIENIGMGDILLGYRIEKKGYSLRMKFNSLVYHFLISNLFNLKLRDHNWMHLYPRKLFAKDKVTISSTGIFMLAEVLIKAKRLGYVFYEFPVDHQIRTTGVATASTFSAALRTFWELVKFIFFNRNSK